MLLRKCFARLGCGFIWLLALGVAQATEVTGVVKTNAATDEVMIRGSEEGEDAVRLYDIVSDNEADLRYLRSLRKTGLTVKVSGEITAPT